MSVSELRALLDDDRTRSDVHERLTGALDRLAGGTRRIDGGVVNRAALIRTFSRRARNDDRRGGDSGARRVLEALLAVDDDDDVLVLADSAGGRTLSAFVVGQAAWVLECVVR